jgi:hypothetical protein
MLLLQISFFALILTYLGHIASGAYWDIQRNSLGVIVLFQILGLVALFEAIKKQKRSFISASVILSQAIVYIEYLVLSNQHVTFYLWGAQLENGFYYIMLANLFITLIILMPPSILKHKLSIFFATFIHSNKLRPPQKIVFTSSILIICSAFLVANNFYFVSYGVNKNNFLSDHGVDNLSSQILAAGNGTMLTVSNVYSLPLYLGDDNYLSISPPLNLEDFYELLRTNIGLRVAVSNDVTASWLSEIGGQNNYLKSLPLLISEVNNTGIPTSSSYDRDHLLLHVNLINSSNVYDVTGDLIVNGSVFGSPETVREETSRIIHFDGKDDQIVFQKTPTTENTSDFSIEIWFKTFTSQNGRFLVMDGYDNGTYNWGVYLSSNSTIMAFYVGHSKQSVQASGTFNDGGWHQIVGSLHGKTIELYIDGKFQASVTIESPFQLSSDKDSRLYVGSWSGQQFYEGYIGYVNMYDKTLGSDQIADQYIRTIGAGSNALAYAVHSTTAYSIYLGKNHSAGRASDVLIETTKVRPANDTFTALDVTLNSKRNENITLILDTGYYSKVFNLNLTEGRNYFEYVVPNVSPSKEMLGFAIAVRATLIAFNDKGDILDTSVVSSTELSKSTFLYLAVILAALLLFYLQPWRREKHAVLKTGFNV